jgi:hypothetical protein
MPVPRAARANRTHVGAFASGTTGGTAIVEVYEVP